MYVYIYIYNYIYIYIYVDNVNPAHPQIHLSSVDGNSGLPPTN